jgi:transposase InsO family protein
VATAAEETLILELVQGMRHRHPRMGGRKLHHELQAQMLALDIHCGRDALFALLRRHDLLVPVKRSAQRTTWSGRWNYPNRLVELQLQRVHQAWVVDITYLTTEVGALYLALITDAYSRFIVGFDLSASLAVEGTLRALNQAMAQTPAALLSGLIHHSDHGLQYIALPYRTTLADADILPSMGEVGNCYDNALAERINGILKCEYALDSLFVSPDHALAATKQAIYLYNFERPHTALNYRKPAQVHLSFVCANVT